LPRGIRRVRGMSWWFRWRLREGARSVIRRVAVTL
jgi:hypothetical protein